MLHDESSRVVSIEYDFHTQTIDFEIRRNMNTPLIFILLSANICDICG